MEVGTKYGISWADYYRSVATLSLLLVVTSELGTPGIEAFPPILWARVLLAASAGSTIYQLWTRRWTYLRGLLN